MYKHLSTILKIAISVAIIAFLCIKASSDESFATILKTRKRWEFLLLGQIFVLAGISLSFIRWRSLVQAVGISFSRTDALRIGFIGHMFGAISIGTFGSDAIRIYYVARENPSQKGPAIAAVFVDRICGLLGLFTLATITMVGFQYVGQSEVLSSESKTLTTITWIAFILTCMGLAGFASLFVLPYMRRTTFMKKLVKRPYVGGFIEKMIEAGIAFQKKPSVLIIALFQSVCVHVFLTLSVYCVAVGLTVPHPSFADHFIISPIAHLANVLPLPGGFGGLEGSLYLFYKVISGDPQNSLGFLVALTYRIATLVGALIGVAFYLRGKKEIQSLVNRHGDESSGESVDSHRDDSDSNDQKAVERDDCTLDDARSPVPNGQPS